MVVVVMTLCCWILYWIPEFVRSFMGVMFISFERSLACG
jgi:hypothetical protein